MKKKNVVVEPRFNENISINNGRAEQNARPLVVNKWDDVDVSVAMQVEGWVFNDPAVRESLRKIMHEKVDRVIDRIEYRT